MEERKFDVGECSQRVDDDEKRSSEGTTNDPILKPNHKIFLSHSGAQKEFVAHLCQALEARFRFPFFDKRPDSLPKGKKFPGLILQAVQQCQCFVVVVSEEYFMSKWPMIELNAFVQANKESSTSVHILPLFYGLTVSEVNDETRRQRWLVEWEKLAKADGKGRIQVEDWQRALHNLTEYNGLPYPRALQEIEKYEHLVVSHICNLVPSDIQWNDTHVKGEAHKVFLAMISQMASQGNAAKVVGLYGLGGIGKTTTCKQLCNALSNEYEGRVCHVEFESECSNSKALLQNASISLLKTRVDVVQQLGEGECIDILKSHLSGRRIFLAIDNVWDDDKSIKQAKIFLTLGFHDESVVVVTARSKETLVFLGIGEAACVEMPEIGPADATEVFLYHAARGRQFASAEDKKCIEECVRRCSFRKGNGGRFHYHPFALEVLGRQLGCFGNSPFHWVQELRVRVREFWGNSVEPRVLDVLRIGFDLLSPREQALFMDVGYFVEPDGRYFFRKWPFDWRKELSALHPGRDGDLQRLLDNLKRKGLLQEADFSSRKISMHDLYREFVVLEAKGKLGDGADLASRKWLSVVVDEAEDLSELEATPAGGCWLNLTRLCIQDSGHCITSLEGIEWRHFPNVVWLRLDGLESVGGTLNLKGMKLLRCLEFQGLHTLERLEGLSALSKLSRFEWAFEWALSWPLRTVHIVGHLPASLKYFRIYEPGVLLDPNVVVRCDKLCELGLFFVDAGRQLDLGNCSSLEKVKLQLMKNLQTVLLPAARGAPRLRKLEISSNHETSLDIRGLDQAVGLVHLYLHVPAYHGGVPSLLSLTRLETLGMTAMTANPSELRIRPEVQELYLRGSRFVEAPRLSGFDLLRVLDLSTCDSLTGMSGMGDLPALEELNLYGCNSLTGMSGVGDLPALKELNVSHCSSLTDMSGMGDLPALRLLDLTCCCSLRRLPDLSKARSLEKLRLDFNSELKLDEEDLQMLAALPKLQPVCFRGPSSPMGGSRLRFLFGVGGG